MKKILVLSVGLMATCVYGRTLQLGDKKQALLHLGRVMASAKLSTIGMFAVNTMEVDHEKVGDIVVTVRDALLAGHAALITTAVELDLEERISLMSSIRFADEIDTLMKAMPLAMDIPEEMEVAGLALQQLRRLFAEQTVVSDKHVAGALQVVTEMQTLSRGWGPLKLPDEEQASEWFQLVRRLVEALATMIPAALPDAFTKYKRQLEPSVQKISTDMDNIDDISSDDLIRMTTLIKVLESFLSTAASIKLYRSDKIGMTQMTVTDTLAQMIGEDAHTTAAVVNMEAEHFDLLSSYFSEQISSRAFAQQYLQFLTKHSRYVSAEMRQAVEQKLADF